MKTNVGMLDRVVRIALGVALLAFALLGEGAASRFGWIGMVPLITAAAGFCPLYTLLGISSCSCGK